MKITINKKSKTKGFTLTELIVVIVIIGILAAVLISTLTGYIKKAKYSNDLQKTDILNDYLRNNSLIYDMNINSRDDLINLLTIDDDNKELDLTTESEGYYLWYDINNNKIILETYESVEEMSKMKKLGASDGKDDISEFFDGFYFLNDDDSSLSSVIKIVNNIVIIENGYTYKEEASLLKNALQNVLSDGFVSAHDGFLEYLEKPIEFIDTDIVIKVDINENGVKILLVYNNVIDHIELSGKYRTEYYALDEIDFTGLIVTAYFKNGDEIVVGSWDPSMLIAQLGETETVVIKIYYTDKDGTTVDADMEIKVKPRWEVIKDVNVEVTFSGSDLSSEISNMINDEIDERYPGVFNCNIYNNIILINAGSYEVTVAAISNDENYSSITFTANIEIKKLDYELVLPMVTLTIGNELTINDIPFPSDACIDISSAEVIIEKEGSINTYGVYTVNGLKSENYNLNIHYGTIKYEYDKTILKFVPVFTKKSTLGYDEDLTSYIKQDNNDKNHYTYETIFNKDYDLTFGGYFTDLYDNVLYTSNIKFKVNNEIKPGGITIGTAGTFLITPINSLTGYSYEEQTFEIIINKAYLGHLSNKEFYVDPDYKYKEDSDGNPIIPDILVESGNDITAREYTLASGSLEPTFNIDDIRYATLTLTLVAKEEECVNYYGDLTITFDEIEYKKYYIRYEHETRYNDYRIYIDEFTVITEWTAKEGYTLIGFTDVEGGEEVKYELGESYSIYDDNIDGKTYELFPVYAENDKVLTFNPVLTKASDPNDFFVFITPPFKLGKSYFSETDDIMLTGYFTNAKGQRVEFEPIIVVSESSSGYGIITVTKKYDIFLEDKYINDGYIFRPVTYYISYNDFD